MLNQAACIKDQLRHTTLALQGISVGQMHRICLCGFCAMSFCFDSTTRKKTSTVMTVQPELCCRNQNWYSTWLFIELMPKGAVFSCVAEVEGSVQ